MPTIISGLQIGSLQIGGVVVILVSIIYVSDNGGELCARTDFTDYPPRLLSNAFYTLFLHPLSHYPGNFLSRLTSWPNWYHASKSDRHTWLHQQHVRYGPIVRFTSNSLSFNTASAVESIYRSRKANVTKSDWYQCVRDSAGGFESTFTARNKARHGVKRRLLSHAFSERALNGYEPRIVDLVGRWLDKVEREANKADGCIDMGEWSSYLILDILGNLCSVSHSAWWTQTIIASLLAWYLKRHVVGTPLATIPFPTCFATCYSRPVSALI